VVAACPCCEFQLRVSAEKKKLPVKVHDLAAFLARCRGLELPDPQPVIAASWAVFDAMISLMTPAGFADVMSELFPQFAAAMPAPMRWMIAVMRILPEPLRRLAFWPMKPMLPLMFPFLAPGMMKKVFPDMLGVIGRKVPMPEHMQKLMPDLMPQVMDRLMPHMLPHVAPMIAGPMVDYLRTRKAAKA
jgi:hypothetical protein